LQSGMIEVESAPCPESSGRLVSGIFCWKRLGGSRVYGCARAKVSVEEMMNVEGQKRSVTSGKSKSCVGCPSLYNSRPSWVQSSSRRPDDAEKIHPKSEKRLEHSLDPSFSNRKRSSSTHGPHVQHSPSSSINHDVKRQI
jgi:hypothetical protein